MDDALLVSRARAGDLDAFGQLYDAYFNRIYDFSWRVLRDADEAADVTQDVFMKAMQNLPGLSKAASFKSWLFTIAHNTAVTRAERAGRTIPLPQPVHEEAFGAFDVPDPSHLVDPALAADDAELSSLVWEAAAALNPRDYALLDLHVRQGLDSAEIAGVMNVSKGNAYTMVSRMKTAAADVIGSYVVARRGSADCDGLRQTLAEFEFPPYTEQVRKAVDAHIKDCETCRGARKRLTAPLEIFGGFAMVPAPLALKGDIWGNVSSAWYASGPGAPGAGNQPVSDSGLPASPYAAGVGGGGGGGGAAVLGMGMGGGGEGWDRNKVMWFIGGVVGLLLFAFAGGALIASAIGGGEDGGAGGGSVTRTPTPSRTPTSETTSSPGVIIHTPTPNLTPSVTPLPSETPLPTDTPPPLPTDTPLPTETPTPAGTATRTPRGGTATPTPTASNPTPTPCGTSTQCPPTPTDTPVP
ncbi:MAG: RNA polymerase sigma factor [Chloroflexi bacterium]|nr:RNA polymerase sigma factor [Chloroflexota bacterium]